MIEKNLFTINIAFEAYNTFVLSINLPTKWDKQLYFHLGFITIRIGIFKK